MTSMFTILIKWMELLANVARHVVTLFIIFLAIYVTVKIVGYTKTTFIELR